MTECVVAVDEDDETKYGGHPLYHAWQEFSGMYHNAESGGLALDGDDFRQWIELTGKIADRLQEAVTGEC